MEQETINNTPYTQPNFNAVEPGKEIKLFSQANMQRIQELQKHNDELHRQIMQIEKDIHHVADPLTLLAEKERSSILIARNSGEIAKIHLANEERLRRISELENRNKRLVLEKNAQRDGFIDIRDPHERAKHASSFFLTQAHIEKNANEIYELNQE